MHAATCDSSRATLTLRGGLFLARPLFLARLTSSSRLSPEIHRTNTLQYYDYYVVWHRNNHSIVSVLDRWFKLCGTIVCPHFKNDCIHVCLSNDSIIYIYTCLDKIKPHILFLIEEISRIPFISSTQRSFRSREWIYRFQETNIACSCL